MTPKLRAPLGPGIEAMSYSARLGELVEEYDDERYKYLVVGHSRGSSHDDRKAQESKEARLKEYHNVRGRENQDSRCLMKPSWRNRRAFYKSRNGG